jgi:hypothetical protein
MFLADVARFVAKALPSKFNALLLETRAQMLIPL